MTGWRVLAELKSRFMNKKQWLNKIMGDPMAESEIRMLINRRILKIRVI
jgi:predicted DNA-binding protein (MmcQ/YjbR family)